MNYQPDYLVSPGEILADYLESTNITDHQLAKTSKIPITTIQDIINNRDCITESIAIELERSLGRPAHFWKNLQLNYDEDCNRLK